MKILVTGCAGFIGYHLVSKLLNNKKYFVYGIDNLNNYYDINLKKDRLQNLKKKSNKFKFFKIDITKGLNLKKNFKKYKYDVVINLAAQAGVRYSIYNPKVYFDSNIKGFYNIMELSRLIKVKHFMFASTSSVYGNLNIYPSRESFNTNSPSSFYASSKISNEVMAYAYSNIYKIKCTALRFFTIYGPFGRPDMAIYKFAKLIDNNKQITLYNNGNHYRDFTYIDDAIDIIIKLIKKPSKNKIPFNLFNIGGGRSVKLNKLIELLEKYFRKKAKIKNIKLQKADAIKTHASNYKIKKYIKFKKFTPFSKGIAKFIQWYKEYVKDE
tara:strand:+ start:670 stop:1644 length:975 start_codon:yes stop_codon:yes gene_type:complete